MRSSNHVAIFLSAVLLFSSVLLISPAEASSIFDHDLSGQTINSDSSLDIDLGNINQGQMIKISFFASEDVDVVILTDSQYNSWTGQDYNKNGSEIDTSLVIYTWTVESTDDYWVVIDNSDSINGGANSGKEVTLTSGYVDVTDAIFGEFQSRLFVEDNSYFHYDFGVVNQGDILHMSISCNDWITHDLDIFLVTDENRNDFVNGQDVWDRNATILESCLEIWDFELTETGHWHIYVENGPRGEAGTDNTGVLVDVSFYDSEKLSTVIQSTTRMIENSDVWRVDFGQISQNDIISFTLSITNEVLANLDVLILSSSEADKYILGQQVSVLGHASLINTGSLDTWDYTFQETGSYSMIIDNSNSPTGGASENKALQVEINIQEVTLLGDWIGWYQSRHYVEDNSFVSFDLGNLESGDEIYYSVSGTSFGSGFLNAFDILLMTDSQYSIYSSGGVPEIIEEASDLDTWISIFQNYTIESNDRYWVVIDAADGPSNGAESNGAWSFDYTIKSSRNQIISPQAKDSNYQMTATHPQNTNLIDQIEDDQLNDNSNEETQQPQEDEKNIGDLQSKSDPESVGMGSMCGAVIVLLIVLIFVRRRRKTDTQTELILNESVNTGSASTAMGFQNPQQSQHQSFDEFVQTNYPPKPMQPPQGHGAQMVNVGQHIQNQTFAAIELPPINQTGYLGADGLYWIEWPANSGKWFHRNDMSQNWVPLAN